jgi:hypothetical protein
MALLSNRTGEVVAGTDENADGRIDQQDDRIATRRDAAVTERADATKADNTEVSTGLRARLRERTAAATKAASATTFPTATDLPADATVVTDRPAVLGPRPRASFWASMSLVLGVVAAAAVVTGLLAGPGVAVGLLAAFAGLGGIASTSRRHVAGKSDALIGTTLGLAAIVVGVFALTGNLSWLNGDTNTVTQVHDWFAAHMSWLLP